MAKAEARQAEVERFQTAPRGPKGIPVFLLTTQVRLGCVYSKERGASALSKASTVLRDRSASTPVASECTWLRCPVSQHSMAQTETGHLLCSTKHVRTAADAPSK
jgi:hypothetical protein